ncbi:hypothetical protein [Paenibacillus sp. FSL P2-0121]|uniref:hypothetical protein n=1 Tax=unclassified Paenibacillus TaxID=185978 RepID=UPI0030CD8B98
MNRVPVMVMRNKENAERYLAASVDVGDWEDENLDVTLDDIQNAYMIIRKDNFAPTIEDFEEHKKWHVALKQLLIEKFGPDPFITLDFEAVCEHYEPVNIEITQEQFQYAQELME